MAKETLGEPWDKCESKDDSPRQAAAPGRLDAAVIQAVEAAIDRAADRLMARLAVRYGLQP